MKFRPKLTFANVISCLALFVALGGSAFAASKLAKNSVGTKQLKNGSVTGIKIKQGTIGSTQLAEGAISGSNVQPGTLTGAQIQPGSLTGTQVNSATLGTVQNASHSVTADTADNGAHELNFETTESDPTVVSPNPGAHQLLTLGSLTIAASCINAGNDEVETYVSAESPAKAEVTWETISFNNPGSVPKASGTIFGPGAETSVPFSIVTGQLHFENGQLVYRTGAETITVSFQTASDTFGPNQCDFSGTAVRATG